MKPIDIVNVAELSPVGDRFVDLANLDGRQARWRDHSGLPRNAIERVVRKPRLSRYRAALAAAYEAKSADALISHLPRMTIAVERFSRFIGRRSPHLAFSFNFTALPTGSERARFRDLLGGVDQFCVYSQYEVGLYQEAFGIPAEKMRPISWTQEAPPVLVEPRLIPDRPFVAAIGGEGRDYAMLIAAARRLPSLHFVIVARPNAALADLPPNVTAHYNLPLATTWGIASRSEAVLVPLLQRDTCCGHITIVSTRLLGLPLITTRSEATREYTEGFGGTIAVDAGEADQLVAAITKVLENPDSKALAEADMRRGRSEYDRARWGRYVEDFLRRTITGNI